MALGHKTGGRKKGTPNKTTRQLKEFILEAAARAGDGSVATYLHSQAIENPASFMTLLGKVLPMQVGSDPDDPIVVEIVQFVREGSRSRIERDKQGGVC
jgi:lauroyl/myristoyl acyltransferase